MVIDRAGRSVRAEDDRFERNADLKRLVAIRDQADAWQRFDGAGAAWLPKAFSWTTLRTKALLPDDWGFVTGLTDVNRWAITINKGLPVVAQAATIGHEYGHLLQPTEWLGKAYCEPRQGLPYIEQEAHAIGAILTVPLGAVDHLMLGDYARHRKVAIVIDLPSSYVELRRTLAVFLGELPGDKRDASAYLNMAMIHHARWMSRIADFMSATAG